MEERNPHHVEYPATNIQITDEGMLITIMFAPSLSMTQAVSAEAMNAIVKKWLESRMEMAPKGVQYDPERTNLDRLERTVRKRGAHAKAHE